MAKSPQTIKSIFGHIPSPSQSPCKRNLAGLPATPASIGDDFTESELRTIDTPTPGHWQLERDYEDVSIGELAPGPRRVSFIARVVNSYHQSVHSKMQQSAKGCFKLLVKDDSALILVCWSL